VALIGGPLMRGDGRVFEVIERAGGVVVLDGTENGTRTLPAPLDRRRLGDDPIMELVDAYFGSIPDAFRRPDTALYRWLDRELPPSGSRGIIVWRYVWCDMWAASVGRMREATGLPVLDLDVSGDDAGFERTAHRIQAFLEVLR
jgi:benzoyl-CoA reductase/2-hydroxyglutaryl-CoA dehydratase subunit BcrC/BadD/HgdB